MRPHNTKHSNEVRHFEVNAFPPQLAAAEGLMPLPVVVDFAVGEEIVFFWIDRTAFVHELAAVRPFQFFLNFGLFRSDYGPLAWMLFFVPNPISPSLPFASVECILNPFEPSQVALWRRLSNQTHWHLTLLGEGDAVADFFEFENSYNLTDSLDAMEAACSGMPAGDFVRARQQFWDRYTLEDLYAMA